MGLYLGHDKVANGGFIGDYDSLPVGSILPYSSENLPTGYLLCDGSEVSRSSYEELFKVIGTTFGQGNASTTFNLPNLKGRVPVGTDGAQDEFNMLGKLGGSKYLQEHNHGIIWGSTIASGYGAVMSSTRTDKDSYITYDSIKNAGDGDGGNLQPYIVVNYIIKASGTAVLTGNVVDSLKENSTTNAPSQRAVNDLKPVVLYNNLAGENTSVLLSDDAENYEYLEIFYSLNSPNKSRNKSMRHCMALGDTFVLDGQWCTDDATIMQVQSAEFLIYQKRITQKYSRYLNNNTFTTGAPAQGNSLYIKRVLGYK